MVGNMFECTADWLQGSSAPWAPSVGSAGPDFGMILCAEPTLPLKGGTVRISIGARPRRQLQRW
jgi:hypothetical protein